MNLKNTSARTAKERSPLAILNVRLVRKN